MIKYDMQCGDAMAIVHKLFAFSFFLLKSFCTLFFDMATYAKCSNQDSNCVYAGTIDDTRDDSMIYARNGSYAAYVSLKCTSNIARQFSSG
jgi:hypothetical protein